MEASGGFDDPADGYPEEIQLDVMNGYCQEVASRDGATNGFGAVEGWLSHIKKGRSCSKSEEDNIKIA